jgi:hypothetical protein
VEEDLVDLAGFELLEGEDPSRYSHGDYFRSPVVKLQPLAPVLS